MSKLKLDPEGDGYVLTASDGSTVNLSDDDILTLAQSAQRLSDHVAAKHSRGEEARAVPMSLTAQVELNNDLHQTEVHLRLIAASGASVWFALPLDVAKLLAEKLPLRVAELEQAKASRTKQ